MTIHIIGAGLAGLACAVRLTETGVPVALYEANAFAGGRTRSFLDKRLGCVIDNGTHLLLSGNDRVNAYLSTIGALDTLGGPDQARLDFLDLSRGQSWSFRPSRGRIPWWLLDPARRVPGTRAKDYLDVLRLMRVHRDATVGECLSEPGSPLYDFLWDPLCISVMNTPTDQASARLLWPVLKETLGKGGDFCRPRLARNGLSASFVDPALVWLSARGICPTFSQRLERVEIEDNRITRLMFSGKTPPVPIDTGDRVVLAVPPPSVQRLLPNMPVPDAFHSIVNVHYRIGNNLRLSDNDGVPLGLFGHRADWMFVKHDLVSITISVGDDLETEASDALAPRLWPGVAQALNHQGLVSEGRLDPASPCPAYRVIKERRATIAQTPQQVARRPPAVTVLRNLFLAGDWTDTGLPATIEGAIRSGETAARLVR